MLPADVVAYGASLFGLTADQLMPDTRYKALVRARFAIYAGLALRAELSGRAPSTVKIGRIMNRDHATIHYGLQRAQYTMERDAEFLEAVCAIATVDLLTFEKSICKPSLQTVEVKHQQRSKTMEHPEYVEQVINAALQKLGQRKLSVYWDGAVIERGEPNSFDVLFDDDDTPFFVEDAGARLFLYRRGANLQVTEYAEVRTYQDMAKVLADIVPATMQEEAA